MTEIQPDEAFNLERLAKARERALEIAPVPLADIREDQIERKWFWDGLLTTGLTILSAKKGNWKSILAMQAAMAISAGRPFLGKTTRRSKVLYLALELDRMALSERSKKLGRPEGTLDAVFSFSRGTDALADLEALIMFNRYSVIVVDMLPALLPCGIDSNDYGQTTEFMLALRRLAQRLEISVLCLMHSGKSARDDFSDSIMGSTGFGGQADAIIVLDRKRGDDHAKIFTTGNHGKDEMFEIRLDSETLELSRIEYGSAPQDALTRDQRAIVAKLAEFPDGLSAFQLSGYLAKSADACRKALARMNERGIVVRAGVGKYRLPGAELSVPPDG